MTKIFPILGKITNLTSRQEQTLMKKFQAKPYLETKEKYELAKLLNISKERIATWFISRRCERGQTSE